MIEAVLSILGERFPQFTREEIMALINLTTDHLLDIHFGQELLEEGEARGRTAEAAAVALRLLNRRCSILNDVTTARIQALPLEALTEALLDFSGPANLATWLDEHGD